VGARFSAPVRTGPGTHPASYTMGTGSFPGVKREGRGHLAPRLKKEQSYTSTPPLGLRGLFWGELYLYLYIDVSSWGAGGKCPPCPPIFFIPKHSVFDYCVEGGK